MANFDKASILDQFGGVIRNSLETAFAPLVDDETISSAPSYVTSEFLTPDEIFSYMNLHKTHFTLFNLNVNSLEKKWNQFRIFIESLLAKNMAFSAITLQECRFSDKTNDKKYDLPGYKKFFQNSICSSNGGLVTYVRSDLTGSKRLNLYKKSSIYEALFVEITGPSIKENRITLGNFYRPPRKNNKLQTIRDFIKEMRPIVNKLKSENSYSVFSGDYNLNLLKISQSTGISEFFDFMTGNAFVPQITLPTRFDKQVCSLLDHVWVNKPIKGALDPVKCSSRVFLKRIAKADHVPGIVSLDILEDKVKAPKLINSQKIDDESIANFKADLIESNLLNRINRLPEGNVEETYSTINETLTSLRDKHFPVKKVRFKRHVHKLQPWMTDIILLNIKKKDELYVKFRKANSATEKYHLKAQLKEMEKNIFEWINEAKSAYYTQQFEKHKNDIKKTWDTISTAINKRRHKSTFPDFFKVNGSNIFEKTEIANEFNKYFVNIGPELANSLDTQGKPSFNSYLGPSASSRFSFKLTNVDTIKKRIGNLPTKKSAGPDGISSIILKGISDEISPVLTIAINQSLKSGVFPTSLKIAKVIPIYKNKGEPNEFGNYRPISLLNVISKIFERVVYDQVYDYFIKNHLFYTTIANTDSENNTARKMRP